MANKIFKEYWEEELSAQMLSSENQKRIRAYICSPLNAKTDYEMFNNMRSARGYMYYAWKEMNFTARAPHAYLPSLLCDRIQEERKMAMDFGIKLLKNSDIVLVCGNCISEGMKLEIIKAAMEKLYIIAFNKDMYSKTKELVSNNGGNSKLVKLDEDNEFMSQPDPLAYLEGGGE